MANTQLGGAETIDSYRKKIMTILIRMEAQGEPLTAWERNFHVKQKAAHPDGRKATLHQEVSP